MNLENIFFSFRENLCTRDTLVRNVNYPFFILSWEVVGAQLVERSLPIPEVCSSNLVIGKNLLIWNNCILSTVY